MPADHKQAAKIYGEYHAEIQAQHNNAWRRCEAHVSSLIPKGAKVFEAHHAIEHARDVYFTEFNKGLPADRCERAVMQAYSAA